MTPPPPRPPRDLRQQGNCQSVLLSVVFLGVDYVGWTMFILLELIDFL